jgi:hypothetical protein
MSSPLQSHSNRGKSHFGELPRTDVLAGGKYKRVGLAVIHALSPLVRFGLLLPQQIKASAERINDRDTIDRATVGHIFGLQLAAAKRTSGRHDCSVPIGQTVLRLNLQCSVHD